MVFSLILSWSSKLLMNTGHPVYNQHKQTNHKRRIRIKKDRFNILLDYYYWITPRHHSCRKHKYKLPIIWKATFLLALFTSKYLHLQSYPTFYKWKYRNESTWHLWITPIRENVCSMVLLLCGVGAVEQAASTIYTNIYRFTQ